MKEANRTRQRLIDELSEVRQRTEEALRESEEKYRELADFWSQTVFEFDQIRLYLARVKNEWARFACNR